MLISTRDTKALGNAALYVRLRNATGQFWDFVGLAWVSPQTNDCRAFLTERADASTTESLYAADVTLPAGGPWEYEIVSVATSEVTVGPFSTSEDAIMARIGVPSGASISADIQTRATVAGLLAGVVEGTVTLQQVMRIIIALVSMCEGGGGSPIHFRDLANTKNRISYTVDGQGNRTAVTLDLA